MKNYVVMLCSMVMLSGLSGCGSDDAKPSATSLGTFAGVLSVVDDPQTQLGTITNVRVTVSVTGSSATIKVIGDSGFDREYTGNVTASQTGSYIIAMANQTKPTSKIAAGDLVISNNTLAITIKLSSDNVTAVKSGTTQTTQISGKINMVGTNLIKQ